METKTAWVLGADLEPEDLRGLGEGVLALLRRLYEARSTGDAAATEVLASPLAAALFSALTQVEQRVSLARTSA